MFDFLSDGFGQREHLGLKPFDGYGLTITEKKGAEQPMTHLHLWFRGAKSMQQSSQRAHSLESSASEEGPAVARLPSASAECCDAAGVAVTVSDGWVTHDATHAHETILI